MSFAGTTTNTQHIRTLADLLIATTVGELATYQQMSRALGFEVRQRFWLIAGAKRVANDEVGALYLSERNVGYRRLPSREAHAVGRQDRQRIRRISTKSTKFMTNAVVHTNDMPNEDRLKIHGEIAAHGLLRHFSLDRNVPRPVGDAPVPTVDSVRRSIDALRQHRTAPPP